MAGEYSTIGPLKLNTGTVIHSEVVHGGKTHPRTSKAVFLKE
jgi:hypothetical protein